MQQRKLFGRLRNFLIGLEDCFRVYVWNFSFHAPSKKNPDEWKFFFSFSTTIFRENYFWEWKRSENVNSLTKHKSIMQESERRLCARVEFSALLIMICKYLLLNGTVIWWRKVVEELWAKCCMQLRTVWLLARSLKFFVDISICEFLHEELCHLLGCSLVKIAEIYSRNIHNLQRHVLWRKNEVRLHNCDELFSWNKSFWTLFSSQSARLRLTQNKLFVQIFMTLSNISFGNEPFEDLLERSFWSGTKRKNVQSLSK